MYYPIANKTFQPISYSQIHCIALHFFKTANFEGILGFSVPSITVADLLGKTRLLVISAFRYTLFVSVF